jgi:hypothetical protein
MELWARAIRPSTFCRFMSKEGPDPKSKKLDMDLAAQIFSAA